MWWVYIRKRGNMIITVWLNHSAHMWDISLLSGLIFPWCLRRLLQSQIISVSSSSNTDCSGGAALSGCSIHAHQGQEVWCSSAGSAVGQQPCSRMAAGWNRGKGWCAPSSLVLSSQMTAALCCTHATAVNVWRCSGEHLTACVLFYRATFLMVWQWMSLSNKNLSGAAQTSQPKVPWLRLGTRILSPERVK